ncbi:MAG: hypothetical protein RLZZ383_1457, partial [Pseudomonadota bacterium]
MRQATRTLVVLAAVGACSRGRAAMADEIVVWHTWRGAEEQALDEARSAFDAATGHRTTLVPVPFGAFATKSETAVPRGNGPDGFLAGPDNLGTWL